MGTKLTHLAGLIAIAVAVSGCTDTASEHAAIDAGVSPDAAQAPDARSAPDATSVPDALATTTDAPPPPIPDASTAISLILEDVTVATNTATALDGRRTYDPVNRTLTYAWTVRSAPAGSVAAVHDAGKALASFTPDRDGGYVIALTVSAGSDSTTATMTLTAANLAPQFAVAPTPVTYTGTPIDVTAIATDANGDSLSYRWSVKGHPEGSSATVSSLSGTVHFVADVDGPYVLEVIASDGRADSAPFDIAVTSYHPIAPLAHRIIDAEASKSLARIVIVDELPATLYLYDPVADTEVTVALPQTPTSVSVSLDGHFAAVGHDGNVSYVDLVNARLVKVYPVTLPVLDVVLGGNGYIYAFPARDQWAALHIIDLQTGYESETSGNFLYAGTVGKLHPDGNRIYAADNGLSPESLFDYDITSATSPTSRLWPYWGDHSPCGDLWFTEDGARIVTRCGETFRATGDAKTDMTYSGTLAGLSQYSILQVGHSKAAGKLLVVRGSDGIFGDATLDEEVWLYGDQYLELDKRQSLGGFVVNGRGFPAHGRFVFADPDGAHYHVFLEADPSSALLQDYAVATYSL